MRLPDLLKNVPPGGRVLDYGCFGWSVLKLAGRDDLHYHGCDIALPAGKPEKAFFHFVDPLTQAIDTSHDHFDLVIASHVLEHVKDPLKLFSELGRVCKPGGMIYIEAPSDRAANIPSDPDVHSHSFHSFWDDPTHVRPWTPAAFYRLAICHGYPPVETKYMTSCKAKLLYPIKWLIHTLSGNGHKLTEALWEAKGWSCFAVIQKPADKVGTPKFKYLSLKNVPRGSEAALALYHASK